MDGFAAPQHIHLQMEENTGMSWKWWGLSIPGLLELTAKIRDYWGVRRSLLTFGVFKHSTG